MVKRGEEGGERGRDVEEEEEMIKRGERGRRDG